MARRLPQTPFDYLVLGVSPALIMLLVGSLVFFLAEVLYSGEYKLRLCFILALFVMATVCVARISMEEGAGYAALFAAPLGLVTFVAMISFVQFSGVLGYFGWAIDLFFIGLIWWCAHKLTWDCTLIDESQDASGKGLLQIVGFDSEGPAETKPKVKLPLWERWFGEGKKEPHAPGVWVVYFSFAALPIFGIGQWAIPAADMAARRYTFWLLVIYVASGLALLLTTSLLGLRRYLRQRRLAMPEDMAAVWVGVGGTLIVGLLVFCFLLPRPRAEYAVSQLPFEITSPVKWPSRWGFGNDGPQDDKLGTKTGPQSQPGGDEAGKPSQQSDRSSTNADQTQGSAQRTEQSGEKGASGRAQGNDQNGASGQSESNTREGQSNQAQSNREGSGQGGKPPGENAASGANNRGSQSQASQPTSTNRSAQQASSGRAARQAEPKPAGSRLNPSAILGWLGWLFGSVLKLLFYGILIAAAAYLAWRYRKELVAAICKFIDELKALWARLFGPKTRAEAISGETAKTPVYKRFSDFTDPFTSGLATGLSPAELVRYTFEAIEAWGRDHNCPREPQQTPHEFAERLAKRQAALAQCGPMLAELYCRAAYAPEGVPAGGVAQVRQVWQALTASI